MAEEKIIYQIQIQGATDATKQLGLLQAELKKINTERNVLIKKQADGNKLTDQEQRRLSILTKKQAEANEKKRQATAITKTQAKANNTLNNAYQQLQLKLSQNTKRYKHLAAAEKENTAEGRKLLATITEQDTKLKKIDATLGQHQRTVGDYKNQIKLAAQELEKEKKALQTKLVVLKKDQAQTKKNSNEYKIFNQQISQTNTKLKQVNTTIRNSSKVTNNYGRSLKGLGTQLMGALGIMAGLYTLIKVFKGIINKSKDFEKQIATLSGVLDVAKEETKALTDQAIRLGGTYPTLAKEVINLQTAYARLGFTQKEILKLTEPTIKGSFALNAELADTATLVGAVVGAYDELGAIDAGNIIDKLTKSTQASQLDFEKLSVALPKVAGAANALNIPLSETLAVLGIAVKATQDASIAGTSYRKILSSNAKASRTLAEGLEMINVSTNKVKKAQELYGDRAFIVALALANQQEETKNLADDINDSLGVATRTAEKQMDTLAGSIDGVSSSWERFVLKTNNSNGTLKGLMDNVALAIDNMTDFGATGMGGAGVLGLFGFGKDAKAEIKKEVTDLYAAYDKATIDELTKWLPIQGEKVSQLREANDLSGARQAKRELSYIVKLIAERTELEANAAKVKAEKLKKFLEKEANEDAKANEKAIEAAKKRKEIENQLAVEMQEAEDEQAAKHIENLNYLLDVEKEQRDAKIKLDDELAAAKKANQEATTADELEQAQLRIIQAEEVQAFMKQFEETNAFEQIEKDRAILKYLLKTKQISEEDYSKASIKLNKEEFALKLGIVNDFANAIQGILSQGGEDNKAAAIAGQVIASAQAVVNTYLAANKALASAPPPFNFIAMGATIAAGLVNVLKINSVKFEDGGIIGGRPHSMGGTTFQGSDGSAFEAERGEFIAVVNKHDAATAEAYSQINSKNGRPYFASGGTFTGSGGGGVDMGQMSDIIRQAVREIGTIPVIVSETEITKTQRSVKVAETMGDF